MPRDPLKKLRRDVVTLVKQDGQRIERVSASVDASKRTITVPAYAANIHDGDTLLRHLPNGDVEEYLVLDSGYEEGVAKALPAEYHCKVEKKTALKPSTQAPAVVYNVTMSGPNNRFNLHSQDMSVNIVDVDPDQLFKELRGVIAQEVEDSAKRDQMLRGVDAMKEARGTGGFQEAYIAFMAVAADHMTLVAPFLPALAQLLQSWPT